jgi:pimeloyl-ACP methyl ester carboxylesterase
MAPIPSLVAAVLLVATAPVVVPALASGSPASAARATDSERVEISTEDKKVLVGTYWAPKDQKGAAPAALLVHDAGGKRADLTEVAERLHKQGFAVLAIDLRHHGDSATKDKPWSELNDDERSKAWTFALRDLKACTAWVGKQGAVHASNVSLLGDRAGCTLVTRHSARDENVRSLTLLDPPAEQFGFNLARDIASLGGLPTFIAVTKESQPKAESIAQSGEKGNDGAKFIEIAVFKGVSIAPVIDKSMVAGIAKFMCSKASPKKSDK